MEDVQKCRFGKRNKISVNPKKLLFGKRLFSFSLAALYNKSIPIKPRNEKIIITEK
jgi:hypothetical protein